MFSLLLTKAFDALFGIRPKQFNLEQSFRTEQSQEGMPYYRQDIFGKEYFLPVKIGLVHLSLPVMSISGGKEIVKTPMVNAEGTVKELISLNDYDIQIYGIMHDPSGEYPETQVRQLANLFKRNRALPINSVLTGIIGIKDVVIEDLQWLETKGFQGIAAYRMRCSSDKKFELIQK